MNVQPVRPPVSHRLSRNRLRVLLLGRSVIAVQIVYGILDGNLLATLTVSKRAEDARRIHLPPRLRRGIRRQFQNIVYGPRSDEFSLLDRAGVVVWDLNSDEMSHRYSGYRQQFFSTNETLSADISRSP